MKIIKWRECPSNMWTWGVTENEAPFIRVERVVLSSIPTQPTFSKDQYMGTVVRRDGVALEMFHLLALSPEEVCDYALGRFLYWAGETRKNDPFA